MSKWLEGGVDRDVADRATETFGPHTAPVQEEEAAAARQSWQGAVPSGDKDQEWRTGKRGQEVPAAAGKSGKPKLPALWKKNEGR